MAGEGRRPRLILHLGVSRTGSTALQGFFARNRALLPAFGLHYPRAPGADGRRATHHGALVAALVHEAKAGSAHPRLGPAAELLSGLLAGAARRRATLLSAEGLLATGAEGAALFGPWREAFEIRAVVFLRRQDEWALSAYRAAVVDPETAEARPLAAWLGDPETAARMDYAALLDAWAAALGPSALRVLRYPHDTPLLPAFLRAAELPSGLLGLPGRGRRVRESVPDEVVRARLRENGGAAEPPRLSMAERDALFARFAPGNREVRARFRPELARLFTSA